MEGQINNDSCSDQHDNTCIHLSPIIEMNESLEAKGQELGMDYKDEPNNCRKSLSKLNLETSAENVSDCLTQPVTPPEVLRNRLNDLQFEYDELKEYTILEKQAYHSDCVPREKVISLEEEFVLLNEKVQNLMQENLEYQRKLEVKEEKEKHLKSELIIAQELHKDAAILVENMKKRLLDDEKDESKTTQGKEILLPNLEICDQNDVVQTKCNQFLICLKDVDHLIELITTDRKELHDTVNQMQIEVSELNRKIKILTEENEQNSIVANANESCLQEKIKKVENELSDVTMKLSLSENKCLESELKKELFDSEVVTLRSEIKSAKIKINSILERFLNFLRKDSTTEDSLVNKKIFTELENNLRNYDLYDISKTLLILDDTFTKLYDEFTSKCEECYDLQLLICQTNDRLVKYEEDSSKCKKEIESLAQEINERIPSRLQTLHNYMLSAENLKLTTNIPEGQVDKNYEKKFENDNADKIKAIKKLMILEIISLNETEDEQILMSDSVENIFSKLMQTIIMKEHEMSNSLQKQDKEEISSLEKTIEKLNNMLKSQKDWAKTLESENDKVNTELVAMKSYNNTIEHKLKALSNDINNKSLEIDVLKRKILDLMTDNQSLISDLDLAKEQIKKYQYSIGCLCRDNEKLNEEIANKTIMIEDLKLKLTVDSDKKKCLDVETNTSSSTSPHTQDKFNTAEEIKIPGSQINSMLNGSFPDILKASNDQPCILETELMDNLKKEADYVKDVLETKDRNITFSEALSSCCKNLTVLKDLIQNIGCKISELEISFEKELQSSYSALEYKDKELSDFRLNISKLHSDIVQMTNRRMNIENFQQPNVTYIHDAVQIRSELTSFCNRIVEFEESIKIGQNIMGNLRDTINTIVNENNNKETNLLHMRELLGYEQENFIKEKQKNDSLSKEYDILVKKNTLLETEIQNVKFSLSQFRNKVFSELDFSFPANMEDSEKFAFINKTLKQYAETQEVCYIITEELRFFSYHFELMLSYIQSLEYKLYFTTQLKEFSEKENNSLKGQLTNQIINQNIELSMFLNQLAIKSPFVIKDKDQAINVVNYVFSEYKLLKESHAKLVKEEKTKQGKICLLEKEVSLLTNQNSSLKFELSNCEDSIRNLRSELRMVRSKLSRKDGIQINLSDIKQKMDAAVQTESICCKRLQKIITEQKEKLDILAAKLSKSDHLQRSSMTSNPYNKQVSHLEGALGQAKERIGRLNLELKQKENHNQELIEALKIHESCQQKLYEANMEIEKLKTNKWLSK